MPYCEKGHRHNTSEGVFECDLRYAERRVGRLANGKTERPADVPVRHLPARRIVKGVVPVLVFSESKNRAYESSLSDQAQCEKFAEV